MANKVVEKALAALEEHGIDAVMAQLSEDGLALGPLVGQIVSKIDAAQQIVILAIALGIVLGTVEGEDVPADTTGGAFVTYQDRMNLFAAMTKAVYDDALITRQHPDAPKSKGVSH